MSQFDFGTINPDTKDGTTLASDLGSWRDALNTLHRGATRPAYAQAGMVWIREVSGTLWELSVFDGDADLEWARINPTENTITIGAGNAIKFEGVPLFDQEQTFTETQIINIGQRANSSVLRLGYTTSDGASSDRFLTIVTPQDIANPGAEPWQIGTSDAIDFLIDSAIALRITGGGDVEIPNNIRGGVLASAADILAQVRNQAIVSPQQLGAAHDPASLPNQSTVTPDFGASVHFVGGQSQNFTIANPQNQVHGRVGLFLFFNQTFNPLTISYGSHFRSAGGEFPDTLTGTTIIPYFNELPGIVYVP